MPEFLIKGSFREQDGAHTPFECVVPFEAEEITLVQARMAVALKHGHGRPLVGVTWERVDAAS